MKTEIKYLIKYPTLADVKLMNNLIVKDIVQIYLKETEPETERIIRKVCTQNSTVCYYGENKKNSEQGKGKNEKIITVSEYLKFVLEAFTDLNEIKKYKLCFSFENQDLEIDVYPGHNSEAILKLELESEDKEIVLPSFIRVIKEVTNCSDYQSSSLAKKNIIK